MLINLIFATFNLWSFSIDQQVSITCNKYNRLEAIYNKHSNSQAKITYDESQKIYELESGECKLGVNSSGHAFKKSVECKELGQSSVEAVVGEMLGLSTNTIAKAIDCCSIASCRKELATKP